MQTVQHQETIAGIIASAVANFGYARPKKWLNPSDFGLGARRVGSHRSEPEQTPQQIAAEWRQWAKASPIVIYVPATPKEDKADAE